MLTLSNYRQTASLSVHAFKCKRVDVRAQILSVGDDGDVWVTGSISRAEGGVGGVSHPITWPVSQCRGTETTGDAERDFTLSHLMEIELSACARFEHMC